MSSWDARLRLDAHGARLLITDWTGHDRLKACLPLQPDHPRAMLTLLEGVALYCGERLVVVTSAEASAAHSFGAAVRGDDRWPADSALVRWSFGGTGSRPRRSRGLGTFRDLRVLRGGDEG